MSSAWGEAGSIADSGQKVFSAEQISAQLEAGVQV